MGMPTIDAGVLIHIASLLYVVAFIVRNQLVLRFLVLIATFLYIGYYLYVPDVPLWDAIGWSAVLGLANIYVIVQLLMERTTFHLSDKEKKLFAVFNTLNPGEFRKLLKITNWHTVSPETAQTLTVEGEICSELFYIMSGDISIQKAGRTFTIPPERFIGEVSYYLKEQASATVTVTGGEYVSWEGGALQAMNKDNPGIRIAVQLILSTDMAHKIAIS